MLPLYGTALEYQHLLPNKSSRERLSLLSTCTWFRSSSEVASAALRTAELIEKQQKGFKTYQQQVLGNGIYKTEHMLFFLGGTSTKIFPILNIEATASVYMCAYKSPPCKEIRAEQS